MRKLTVKLKPNFLMKKAIGSIFKKIESVELKELLRLDFSKGTKIGVGEITLKKGEEFGKFGRKFEVLDILNKDGRKYTCLIKVNVPKTSQKLLKFFDFDLIYDIPTRITPNELMYSVIGEEKNLKRFLKMIRLIGKPNQVIFKEADYRGIGITNSLTQKQKRILQEAIKWGYYSYPRKIDTKELSQRLGISRTTLVEHLRKAENRVMGKMMFQ